MTRLLKWGNPLAAATDQAWLSLLNFAVSFAFIWFAPKEEYGYYILLFTPLLLVQNIQNALANSPLATLLPTMAEHEKTQVKKTAATIHLYLALICGALGFILLLAYGKITGFHAGLFLVAGFTLAIFGTIAREAQRSFAYAQSQAVRALNGDLVYGLVLLTGLSLAIFGHNLSAGSVLLAIGMAGLVALLPQLKSLKQLELHSDTTKKFWDCGRWALPSVIVTWITLSAYPYFAGEALGVEAVADIGAARLFLMPVGLVMTAWANWYRPKISGWRSSGNMTAIINITQKSLLLGIGALTLLGIFLYLAYPLLEKLLGAQYKGLLPLVLMWLLYFTISLVRNVYMATLMTDANGYKILHHITWVALAISLPGFLLLSENGTIWVIGVLCAAEFIQTILVAFKARQYWKADRANSCDVHEPELKPSPPG